ncbi:MAG: hypothetical protein U9O59_07650 [Actinomycetota bacterium]|nr:hypothetical protein [Actinomycetota bacterium]
MVDFEKLIKLPYITKRIYVLRSMCELRKVDLEYLFGLFNLYNIRNSGKWFWQKPKLTGRIKNVYKNLNAVVDKTVKDLSYADEKRTGEQIKSASTVLGELLVGLEENCEIDRKKDFEEVKKNLGRVFKELIDDNVKKAG